MQFSESANFEYSDVSHQVFWEQIWLLPYNLTYVTQ